MNRTQHRTIAITAVAATTAIASVIATPAAIAGGTGDFYKAFACSVNGPGTARVDVTNYDIATGQRYHLDMDSPSGWPVRGLYIDGVKQPKWNDTYKDFADRSSWHHIRADWYDGTFGKIVYCSFSL